MYMDRYTLIRSCARQPWKVANWQNEWDPLEILPSVCLPSRRIVSQNKEYRDESVINVFVQVQEINLCMTSTPTLSSASVTYPANCFEIESKLSSLWSRTCFTRYLLLQDKHYEAGLWFMGTCEVSSFASIEWSVVDSKAGLSAPNQA